jgi:hypothetical protein
MRKNFLFFRGKALFSLLLIFFLTGCDLWGPQPIPASGGTIPTMTLVPTITPISTVTPIPDQPTNTPGANIVALPSLTAQASETAGIPLIDNATLQGQPEPTQPAATLTPPSIPTPTNSPIPVGHLTGKVLGLIPSSQGLWAMYPDGTRTTLLTTDPILALSISPSGWAAAYVTNPDPQNLAYQQPYGYILKIITLYDDQIYTVTPLDPTGLSASSPSEVLDSAYQSINAYNNGALAWSPDSTTLAFTSIHEAPSDQPASSDIYLYRLANNTFRRLTQLQLSEGPGHPYHLSWAPNGQSLYFAVAYSFGTGAGFLVAGAWVNGLDGSSIQVAPSETTTGENILAWLGSDEVLLSSSNSDCGNQNIRKVNFRNGETTALWLSCYQSALYDRRRAEILVSVTPDVAGPGANNPPGLYIISIKQLEAKEISNHGFERLLSGNPFGRYSAAWYGYNPGEGLFTIQRTGETQPLITGAPFDGSAGVSLRPLFSLPNADWLWSGDGLYVGHPGSPPQQITEVPTDNLTTSPTVYGLYFFLAPDKDTTRLFGVRARDWKPFIVDPRIADPTEIDWTG